MKCNVVTWRIKYSRKIALNCAISSSPAKNSIVFLKRAHLLWRAITRYDTHFAPMVEVKGLIHHEIGKSWIFRQKEAWFWRVKGCRNSGKDPHIPSYRKNSTNDPHRYVLYFGLFLILDLTSSFVPFFNLPANERTGNADCRCLSKVLIKSSFASHRVCIPAIILESSLFRARFVSTSWHSTADVNLATIFNRFLLNTEHAPRFNSRYFPRPSVPLILYHCKTRNKLLNTSHRVRK